MTINVEIKPYVVSKDSVYPCSLPDAEQERFPCLYIGRDSYLAGTTLITGADIYSPYHHNVAIGRACSVAHNTVFIISMNHRYRSVSQGVPSFLRDLPSGDMPPLKGTVLLQNDVWIGYGATVMAGVTLHNGCLVAANAVVTKDVPPYAVVGGNPARILLYRFDEYTIAGLQKIAWWDWTPEMLEERRNDFLLPVQAFVEKYLPEAEQMEMPSSLCTGYPEKKTVLVIPDVECDYPLYPRIFHQYFGQDRPNTELLIYLPEEYSTDEIVYAIEGILKQYEACDSYVTLQTGVTLDERVLFAASDYFVAARGEKTVPRSCLADTYHVRILYGTDEPIFPPGLH